MAPGEGKLIGMAILRTLYLGFIRAFIPTAGLACVLYYFIFNNPALALLNIPFNAVIIFCGWYLYFKGFVRCDIFVSNTLKKMSDARKKSYKFYTEYLERISCEMRSLVSFKYSGLIFSFVTLVTTAIGVLKFLHSRGA